MRHHIIDHWQTPATAYPRSSVGGWGISSRVQEPGVYRMQDRDAFYYQPKPIELTVLKEGERVWFTDEPRQMYALAEIGLFRAKGRVIVGGLGLGLIHYFLRMNPAVSEVVTIERAQELEALVWPHMKVGKLFMGDFYEVLPQLAALGYQADTIITDFIFGYQSDATWAELQEQKDFCFHHFRHAQFLEHGYQARLDAERVASEAPFALADGPFDLIRIVT